MASAHLRRGRLDVPLIDISPFRPDGAATDRVATAQQIDHAARTVGFMQVTGHGIPADVLEAFARATDRFFALDLAAKSAYRCPPEVNRGYSPPKSESLASSLGIATAADLFEAFNVGATSADHPGLDLSPVDYPDNVYPDEVPGFAAAVTAWFGEAGRVARVMTTAFAAALGLDEHFFDAYTDHSIDVLRMNNYRLPADDLELEPDQLGMGAHTDYGIVTILWADAVPGLEILGSDGGWHPVSPAPGALLVNLGDAMARWTNDQWISTMHRVAAPRVDGRLVPRRSAAYFHDGNADAVIACVPTCLDPAGHALYEPITVREHLTEKLAGSRSGVLNPNAAREAARLAR